MNLTSKVLLGSGAVLGLLVLTVGASVRLPGNDAGYEPVQPIPYSHRLHAGELAMDCLYCHYGAAQSAAAGVPPLSVCMNCHQHVTAARDAVESERLLAAAESRPARPVESAPLRVLYDALGLDAERRPIPGRAPRSIAWVRVHDLPDFVTFDHRAHVSRGVTCQTCHGPVQTMERVRQVETLGMGWCVECHRANHRDGTGAVPAGQGHPRVDDPVSTDCSVCHQ